jgi:BirA family biotin operon repressor/biotin-[acetyl-CoA-carboxylase] ligase
VLLHRFERVESTQIEARRLAEAGAAHGTVVVAEEQSAGRGRMGRTWVGAGEESLLLSIVLRPPGLARDAPLLTLGAAAGVSFALGCQVKWPNDLVDEAGRKLGGFLGELELDGDLVRFVVLGLGLNVNQRSFPEELRGATSLWRVRGEPQDRDAILSSVVAAILGWSADPGRLDLWRQRSHTLGRRVRVAGREGVATGLRDDGALIVDGTPVTTGEVELTTPAPR